MERGVGLCQIKYIMKNIFRHNLLLMGFIADGGVPLPRVGKSSEKEREREIASLPPLFCEKESRAV
jgi:hypothetical protein